jgi:hypothetical protein
MADQWAEPTAIDGDFTVAEAVSLPVFSSPIRATTAEYTFTQDWMILRKYFESLALNTAHPSAGLDPDYSDYLLVAEGPRQDMGGGVVKWTRTYAKVPDSHDEFESYSYAFIGFAGVFAAGVTSGSLVLTTGRPRTARIVNSRIHHDYFLTGPGGIYATAGDIPKITATHYYAGGLLPNTYDIEFISDALGLIPATNPSRTTYNGWVTNAATYGWAAGIVPSGTNPGQLIVEDSRLTRWMGGIYERQSRFVLAI